MGGFSRRGVVVASEIYNRISYFRTGDVLTILKNGNVTLNGKAGKYTEYSDQKYVEFE